MNNLQKAIVASIAMLAAGDQAFAEAVSGPQITELLTDSVAVGVAPNGKDYTIEYHADGSADFAFDDGSFSDSGEWTVQGDSYCMKWRKIRKGELGCWTVIDRGDKEYFFDGLGEMRDATLNFVD